MGETKVLMIIPVREAILTDEFTVKRILPFRAKRSVGSFVFLDHMGPVGLSGERESDGSFPGDVAAHPHIGLATVTYLFAGELMHRDSLGTEQIIRPGDLNWMTAGRGIVHSERGTESSIGSDGKRRLHGLQAWVALPQAVEETEPTFQHVGRESLPVVTRDGVRLRVVAGALGTARSTVQTHSKLFYVSAEMEAGAELQIDASDLADGSDPALLESAIYLVSGKIEVAGTEYSAPVMVVFEPGSQIAVRAEGKSELMLLGGEPLDGPRNIWWNFVSSSKERIEQAKKDWKDQRFQMVPGETDFVPLP